MILKKGQNAVTSVNLLTQQISNINGKILASGIEAGDLTLIRSTRSFT